VIVVDCSYALAIVMPDEHQPQSAPQLADGLVLAPPIWPYEVANAFRSAVRRGRLAEADVMVLCAHLEELQVSVATPDDLSVRRGYIAAMARGLSAYDASYLELALQRGAALATMDRNMAEAARASGLAVLS
jgi:predicted nucleic acid-binding protein